MELFKVNKPGLSTTIQDLGRQYFQEQGVPVGGAMDKLSLRLANILVGNDEGEGALEVTLIGPELKFLNDAVISITGADLSPKINGKEVLLWETIEVAKGDILTFGRTKYGCRCYIAIMGGLNVSKVMGSYSTFNRGKFGGLEGRAFRKGDIISLREMRQYTYKRKLPSEYIPDFKTNQKLRFILGPQAESFIKGTVESFSNHSYTILPDSDRMGYRLNGKSLQHKETADIISEYVIEGSIQVPGDGQPIILMSDCQTTGGYTKLGVVISVDLPFLAQKKPGDKISFEVIDLNESQKLLRKREKFMHLLKLNNWYTIKSNTV